MSLYRTLGMKLQQLRERHLHARCQHAVVRDPKPYSKRYKSCALFNRQLGLSLLGNTNSYKTNRRMWRRRRRGGFQIRSAFAYTNNNVETNRPQNV